MKVDICNPQTLNMTRSRNFTVDLSKEPTAAEVCDVAEVRSYMNVARNEADEVCKKDNDYENDMDGNECRVLLQDSGVTTMATSVYGEEMYDDAVPVRVVRGNEDKTLMSDHRFEDGEVQSIFEQRVLDDGRAEIFRLNRNANGTITVSYGVCVQPESPPTA